MDWLGVVYGIRYISPLFILPPLFFATHNLPLSTFRHFPFRHPHFANLVLPPTIRHPIFCHPTFCHPFFATPVFTTSFFATSFFATSFFAYLVLPITFCQSHTYMYMYNYSVVCDSHVILSLSTHFWCCHQKLAYLIFVFFIHFCAAINHFLRK